MTARRTVPAAATTALLLFSGLLAGCGEDGVYDNSGPVEEDNRLSTVTPNPGLADAGTASPIPDQTDDAGIVGDERSDGQPND